MPNRCVAPGCRPKKGYSVFLFPKDPELNSKWRENSGRKTFNKYSGLCEQHFSEDCFVTSRGFAKSIEYTPGRYDLKKTAVPTIFEKRALETCKPKKPDAHQNGVGDKNPMKQESQQSNPDVSRPRSANRRCGERDVLHKKNEILDRITSLMETLKKAFATFTDLFHRNCDEIDELQQECEKLDSKLSVSTKEIVDRSERVESGSSEPQAKIIEVQKDGKKLPSKGTDENATTFDYQSPLLMATMVPRSPDGAVFSQALDCNRPDQIDVSPDECKAVNQGTSDEHDTENGIGRLSNTDSPEKEDDAIVSVQSKGTGKAIHITGINRDEVDTQETGVKYHFTEQGPLESAAVLNLLNVQKQKNTSTVGQSSGQQHKPGIQNMPTRSLSPRQPALSQGEPGQMKQFGRTLMTVGLIRDVWWNPEKDDLRKLQILPYENQKVKESDRHSDQSNDMCELDKTPFDGDAYEFLSDSDEAICKEVLAEKEGEVGDANVVSLKDKNQGLISKPTALAVVSLPAQAISCKPGSPNSSEEFEKLEVRGRKRKREENGNEKQGKGTKEEDDTPRAVTIKSDLIPP